MSCCVVPHGFAECIPTSFTEWVLPESTRGPLLQDICAGINTARVGGGLRPLKLATRGATDMKTVEVGDHVVLGGVLAEVWLSDMSA